MVIYMNKLIDLNIYNNNDKKDYDYSLKDNEIIINVKDKYDDLDIYYDENVYELTLPDDIKITKEETGELKLESDKPISFKAKINDIYVVKVIYSYLNDLIKKDLLIEYLNIYIKISPNKEYKKDLEELVDVATKEDSFFKIYDKLMNLDVYIELAKKMSAKEVMLLITRNIAVPDPPNIDQDFFDEIVNEAINYDYAPEKVWRLAMHYDEKGYNFDAIDKYFINLRDVYYFGEYISSIWQTDREKLVREVIQTKDKEFINGILNSNFIPSVIGDELVDKLRKSLGEENE